MLTIVVVLNLLIALSCLMAAWQIHKLRRKLARVADVLTAAERSCHSALYKAPTGITKGQTGIYRLRRSYQNLDPQLQRLQRFLSLLNLAQSLLLPRSRSKILGRSRRLFRV